MRVASCWFQAVRGGLLCATAEFEVQFRLMAWQSDRISLSSCDAVTVMRNRAEPFTTVG